MGRTSLFIPKEVNIMVLQMVIKRDGKTVVKGYDDQFKILHTVTYQVLPSGAILATVEAKRAVTMPDDITWYGKASEDIQSMFALCGLRAPISATQARIGRIGSGLQQALTSRYRPVNDDGRVLSVEEYSNESPELRMPHSRKELYTEGLIVK